MFEAAAGAAAEAAAGVAVVDPSWKTSQRKIDLMETNLGLQHDIVMSTVDTVRILEERCRDERRSTRKAWRLASKQEAIAVVRQAQLEEELAKVGCSDCQKRREWRRTATRDGGIAKD